MMSFEPLDEQMPLDEPAYVISVAARLASLHPQTLRYYERLGLVKPARTQGRIRMYSRRNIETLRRIVRLTEDLGVNLAGVEVILNMSERVTELQEELELQRQRYESELQLLGERIRELEALLAGQAPTVVLSVNREDAGADGRPNQRDVPLVIG